MSSIHDDPEPTNFRATSLDWEWNEQLGKQILDDPWAGTSRIDARRQYTRQQLEEVVTRREAAMKADRAEVAKWFPQPQRPEIESPPPMTSSYELRRPLLPDNLPTSASLVASAEAPLFSIREGNAVCNRLNSESITIRQSLRSIVSAEELQDWNMTRMRLMQFARGATEVNAPEDLWKLNRSEAVNVVRFQQLRRGYDLGDELKVHLDAQGRLAWPELLTAALSPQAVENANVDDFYAHWRSAIVAPTGHEFICVRTRFASRCVGLARQRSDFNS